MTVYKDTPITMLVALALIAGFLILLVALVALVTLRRGRRRGTAREIVQSLSSLPTEAIWGYALAQVDARNAALAEAAALLVAQRAPEDARAQALLGSLLAQRGAHRQALAAYDIATLSLTAPDGPPSRSLAHLPALLRNAQAASLSALGESGAAAERAREAVQLDAALAGRQREASALIQQAMRELELEREAKRALPAWERGRSTPHAFGFDDPVAAVEFYREALRAHPDDGVLQSDLAQALHASGDHQAAAERFAVAVERRPDDPWLRYQVGALHWRLGQTDEALRELAVAADLAPESVGIGGAYALALAQRGRLNDAERALRRARTTGRDSAPLARLSAEVAFALGKLPEAVGGYAEAERLGERGTRFHLRFAELLQRYDDPPGVEREFRLAIAEAPQSGEAYAAYGAFLVEQRRFDEAERALLTALQARDGRPAHSSLAGLYLLERRLNEAQPHIYAALEYDPRSPQAQEHQASLLLLRGQAAQAYETAQRLIDRGVTSSTLRLTQASALFALHHTLEAQVTLREALRADPELGLRLLAQADELSRLGYIRPALEQIDRALALIPGWPDALALRQRILHGR